MTHTKFTIWCRMLYRQAKNGCSYIVWCFIMLYVKKKISDFAQHFFRHFILNLNSASLDGLTSVSKRAQILRVYRETCIVSFFYVYTRVICFAHYAHADSVQK